MPQEHTISQFVPGRLFSQIVPFQAAFKPQRAWAVPEAFISFLIRPQHCNGLLEDNNNLNSRAELGY